MNTLPQTKLKENLSNVKKKLIKGPLLITLNGKAHFGICDLRTFEIANEIKKIEDTLVERTNSRGKGVAARKVFKEMNQKYGLKDVEKI